MRNSECRSSFCLSSLMEVRRLKKLMRSSMFSPVRLEMRKMGMTSSVEVIL